MSKAKEKRTEIINLKIKNWSRYQVRKELKTMHYFRVQNDIFFDAKFASLTPLGKFIWFALMHEATRQYMGDNADRSDGQVELNVNSFARQHRMNARWVRSTIFDLEQLQMVIDVVRHENVPREEKRREEKTREEKSTSLLTNLHTPVTISSQTSQTANKSKKPESKTAATWESFSNAYRKRYGSDPVRNATTNSQMSNFVKRIGEEESPGVAEFYVSLVDQFYLNACHSTGILLRDCEKLRTMWANGIRNTKVDAKTSHWREQARQIEAGEL